MLDPRNMAQRSVEERETGVSVSWPGEADTAAVEEERGKSQIEKDSRLLAAEVAVVEDKDSNLLLVVGYSTLGPLKDCIPRILVMERRWNQM